MKFNTWYINDLASDGSREYYYKIDYNCFLWLFKSSASSGSKIFYEISLSMGSFIVEDEVLGDEVSDAFIKNIIGENLKNFLIKMIFEEFLDKYDDDDIAINRVLK